MKVIISGAGIAGLATAGFLIQQGLRPVIIEKASGWSKVGYGISLWGNGMKIMQALGLDRKLIEKGCPISQWSLRDSKLEVLTEANLDFKNIPPLVAIHRADLHSLLLSGVPDEFIRMNTTIEEIETDKERVKVLLSDGTRMEADLLIGADGVHSNIRSLMFPDEDTEAEKMATAVFSFWIPESLKVPAGFNEIYAENGIVILIAPVNNKKMCSIAFSSKERPKKDHLQLLKDNVNSEESLLQHLIKVIEKGDDIFHDHIYRVKINKWIKKRILLLGDAAHAMHPIVGMGASMALEDAYVINQEILDHKYGHLNKALQSFQKRRQKRTAKFHRQATITEGFTFLENDLLNDVRNKLIKNSELFEGFFIDNAHKIAKDVLSDI